MRALQRHERMLLVPFYYLSQFALPQGLHPSYRRLAEFLKTEDVVRPLLNRLWQHVLGIEMTVAEIEHGLQSCRTAPVGEEECCPDWRDAIDSVGATLAVLKACQASSLDSAVTAAKSIRSVVDRPLWTELSRKVHGGITPHHAKQIEAQIAAHPTMVAERRIESAQLRLLLETETITEQTIAQLLTL
jgi:hypothetical protein